MAIASVPIWGSVSCNMCLFISLRIDTSELVRGLPFQLILINENSLCSIVFHLLVPGGKWQTEISRPVWSANRWRSFFQSFSRYPFDPPESAVTINRVDFA